MIWSSVVPRFFFNVYDDIERDDDETGEFPSARTADSEAIMADGEILRTRMANWSGKAGR